jgi:hypothetical protein
MKRTKAGNMLDGRGRTPTTPSSANASIVAESCGSADGRFYKGPAGDFFLKSNLPNSSGHFHF